MSGKYIPENINAYRFAEQNLGLDGIVNVSDMPRLCTNLVVHDTIVNAKLNFGRDEEGVMYLKGNVATTLQLQCQRCLEPYPFEITSDFVLGIVNTADELNSLPEHYGPALAKEGQLAVRELIEDELLLNLPIIPRHAPEQCKVQLPFSAAELNETKEKVQNPFHVLENLKDK